MIVSDRPDTLGSYDIYVTKRTCRTCPWSEPKNVVEINSNVYEAAPSIASDNLTLYSHRRVERLETTENGKNAIFSRGITAETGIFAISSLKIRTWTTMPLKVGIIATFKRLLSDCSLRRNGKKGISR
jgi:hypothetical protein